MKLSTYLTEKLLKDEIISVDDKEIVRYGLENLGGTLLGMFLALGAGFCFGDLYEGLVLWLFIFPLRKNAGGYHADTKMKCFLMSAGMVVVAFIVFYLPKWSCMVYGIICLFFAAVICREAPVENRNKVLDENEVRVYRRRTRIVILSEGVFFIVAIILRWRKIAVAIGMAIAIVGVSLIMGKIKSYSCRTGTQHILGEQSRRKHQKREWRKTI